MTTPRKDTALAKKRREVKAVAEVQDAQPRAFVLPPIAQVLASAQRVVATELAFMEQDQQENVRLDDKGAKKLQALVSALTSSVAAEKSLSDEELGEMSDEELEAELLAELERVRARKAQLVKP